MVKIGITSNSSFDCFVIWQLAWVAQTIHLDPNWEEMVTYVQLHQSLFNPISGFSL